VSSHWGGPKQRAVLAILLLRVGEVVSRERLIDELWSERAPASAINTVRVYVSNLRKVLGDGVLITRGGGYAMARDRVQVDADRFRALVAEGRRLLADGDPAGAGRSLRDALGIWRGPPLADFAYEPFAQAEIGRLEEERLAAWEERVDADLALGEGARLVAELEAVVREHPLRERLRGKLILALYRSDRQTDALTAYRDFSVRLREELGLEPGRALKELERSILQHDASIDAVPRAPAARVGSLPVAATAFLGRARELAEATALLWRTQTRLMTLTGAGGSGKTRLALRVAETAAGDYRDGVWFVAFADIADPDLIAATICHALGLADQPSVTPTRRLQEWLRDRSLLLVLDNLEQLADGTPVLGELLASCPGLTFSTSPR